MSFPEPLNPSLDWLAGGGEMGELIRRMDWSENPLGPPETWPQSLKTSISLCLASTFPISIIWGPSLVQLYNDAYRPICGAGHPVSMGQKLWTTWEAARPVIGPVIDTALSGASAFLENQRMFLERNGYVEETFFTFSFSPVRDERGEVGGLFHPVTETTERMLGSRRTQILRDFMLGLIGAKSLEDIFLKSCALHQGFELDIPFLLFYQREAGVWTLKAHAGICGVSSSSLASLSWPFAEAGGELSLANVLASGFGADCEQIGPYPEAPHSAFLLPISLPGGSQPEAFAVAGVSSRRSLDDDYKSFFENVKVTLDTALASVRARETEQKRVDALAEIDRAKTEFFSNVSHEFRTPLTLMLGIVEDSLSDSVHPLTPMQRERQEFVRRNGLRLLKLVNTLLDFARIEAGRAQISFVKTDLAALTTDIAASFESAMASGGLTLKVDCSPLPEAVYVDPAMWEKMVLNLLSNAFKFTFTGSVRLALRWLGSRVEFSVEDTGTGIPADELERIFERFHRVEGARGRSFEGTGIGLSLVQQLARLHGGGVTVKSTLGKGSTFTISLPTGHAHLPADCIGAAARTSTSTGIGPASFLAEVSQWDAVEDSEFPSDPSSQLLQLAPRAPSALHAGKRLLIADDNADMRAYLTRLLSPHWNVEAVGNGERALAAARLRAPDLILSDVMMPVMSGLELVRAVRADEALATIPVMLLSARAGEEATIDGLRSGADEYLVKPFSANELLARVNSQLTVSHLRQEAIRSAKAHAEETASLLAQAQQATRLREETMAIVSHDLRTPLGSIRLAADLLHRSLGDSGQSEPDAWSLKLREQADVIRRSAVHMSRLVSDLLDLASIDAGSLSLAPTLSAPHELLRECEQNFGPQAMAKGLRFRVESASDLPPIPCDHGRILQVLSNLVSNAIKFTPPGGEVCVRAVVPTLADSMVFTVSDTGGGISPDAQARIFDRYWHAAQSNREGHGLGLSIAQGIVNGHGGALWLESSDENGSVFTFALPLGGSSVIDSRSKIPPALETKRKLEKVIKTEVEDEFNFLQGGGEMGALMRSMDWSKYGFGPVEHWPQSLRTTVSMMLRSPYPIGLYWGPELRLVYNDSFRPIMGEKHPETMGARVAEALAEEWNLLGPLVQRVLDTGEPLYIENGKVPLARRQGGLREEAYFTWSFVPTIGEDGTIAGIVVIVSETTGKVVSDRCLGILRELSLRTAIDKSVESVFHSIEAVFEDAKHDLPFSLLYNVKADGARLESCTGVLRGDLAAPVRLERGNSTLWPVERVAATREEELISDLDVTFGPLPGGPWPEPATHALLLPVPMGTDSDSVCVLVAGLSPLRALNDEYRSFLQLLARQLAASLSNARAYEMEKQRAEDLARLDQAKTAFFSNVSHELRTPLTLILGPVEDALAAKSKALEGANLELVRRNALRLYKLVNTLLDFSRIEAGRAQATFVPLDLADFTRGIASAFESVATSSGLNLVLDCPTLPEAIYVDPEMWEKIVLNLLSNAVKFTHQGEIRVALEWDGEKVVFSVQDTGVGIPPDELSRIFERFYRVRATHGRSFEGTGIGLALVKDLLKLHGGGISASSTLGRGTLFTAWIPRGAAHLPTDRVERTPRPRTTATGATLYVKEAERWSKGPDASDIGMSSTLTAVDAPLNLHDEITQSRILVVDDNLDMRTYVTGLLASLFPHVVTAADGEEALASAQASRPDLILSDVMMPKLDGFGLVKALRGEERTKGVPIILLSARAGDDAKVDGLHSGADDYLVKPFSARELIARVCTQLEMARVRRELARHEMTTELHRATIKARDEWLTVVGHELRTPLATLTLNVQMLLRKLALDEKQQSPVEKSLSRLRQLVEHFVDVAGLAAGSLQTALEETDLREVVQETLESKCKKAGISSLGVELIAPESVVCSVDRHRIAQLLASLIDNAFKFSPGMPVTITVSRKMERAIIQVADHGTGVVEGDRVRLFERFQRGVSTENHGGFGLGLWLARLIAQAHNGTLEVSETAGGGATFTLTLPLQTSVSDV